MDFNTAIVAHAQWKGRLVRVIDGRESADPQIVGRDDACPLGRWIHGSASRRELPAAAHDHLRDAHASFHRHAAQVVGDALAGRREQALAGIDLEGDFTRTSTWVIRILDALRQGHLDEALRLRPVEVPAPAPQAQGGRPAFFALGLGAAVLLVTLTARSLPGGPGPLLLVAVLSLVVGVVAALTGGRLLTTATEAHLRRAADLLGLRTRARGARLADEVCRAAEAELAHSHYLQRLGTDLISASAANVGAVSEVLTTRMSDAASRSAVVSTAADRINEVVSGIAGSVEEVSTSLSGVSTGLDSGATLVHSVQGAVRSSGGEVNRLDAAGESVAGMVGVIVGIAEQTNMLALNATIEAARAGDVGKGFAVVASEVKELAGETEGATRQITGQIERIRSVSQTMIGTFSQLDVAVCELDAQQTTMADTVRAQSDSVTSIASRVSAAAGTLHAVTDEVGSLGTAVGAADQLTGVAAATAHEMRQLAVQLDSRVTGRRGTTSLKDPRRAD